MILVISHRRGFEADFVIDALRNRSIPVCRFNYDEYPTSARLTMLWQSGDFKVRINRSPGEVPAEDIKLAWFHREGRFRFKLGLPADSLKIAEAETDMTVAGLWECAPWQWVQHPAAVTMASNKLNQLVEAQRLGFSIPRTLITNNVQQAAEFIDRCEQGAIIKDMDTQFAEIQGVTYMSWTEPIAKDQLLSAGIPGGIPICIQEYVPKRIEIRATVVGDRVFPVAIDSQANPETRYDFRKGSLITGGHHYTPTELPPEIEHGCVALLEVFGLDYGAIDFVLKPDGSYTFLELNTTGAWVWAEKLTGLPITDALADLLVRRHDTGHRLAATSRR
jgi:glutathione synthase/RimK-type ligase-like ATP-grasp enzyme